VVTILNNHSNRTGGHYCGHRGHYCGHRGHYCGHRGHYCGHQGHYFSKTMKVYIKCDNGVTPRLIQNNDLALRARSLFSISLGVRPLSYTYMYIEGYYQNAYQFPQDTS
jgi:hypothetical protein